MVWRSAAITILVATSARAADPFTYRLVGRAAYAFWTTHFARRAADLMTGDRRRTYLKLRAADSFCRAGLTRRAANARAHGLVGWTARALVALEDTGRTALTRANDLAPWAADACRRAALSLIATKATWAGSHLAASGSRFFAFPHLVIIREGACGGPQIRANCEAEQRQSAATHSSDVANCGVSSSVILARLASSAVVRAFREHLLRLFEDTGNS